MEEWLFNNSGVVGLGTFLLLWKFGPAVFAKITGDIKKVKADSDEADAKLEVIINARFEKIEADLDKKFNTVERDLNKKYDTQRDIFKDLFVDTKNIKEKVCGNKVDTAKLEAKMYKELYKMEKDNGV